MGGRSGGLAYPTPDEREEDTYNTEDCKEDEPDMQACLELWVIRRGYFDQAYHDCEEQHRDTH